MSNETNSDEIPVEVLSENETDSSNKIEELDNMDNNDNTSEDLSKLLELEKQKTLQFEEKLKHVLADFQNLSRKTKMILRLVLILKLMNSYWIFLKFMMISYEQKK